MAGTGTSRSTSPAFRRSALGRDRAFRGRPVAPECAPTQDGLFAWSEAETPTYAGRCAQAWTTRALSRTPPVTAAGDRQSVEQGKSVSLRDDLGGRRIFKKK